MGNDAAAVALLGTAVGDIHGGLLPFPKARPVLCWQRAALALLPVGSGESGAGCYTADPWDTPDPVMPDTGNTGRGRLGGARDTHGAPAHEEGDAHSCLRASRTPPVPGRYFSLQDVFQPRPEEPVLSICSSAEKGLPSYCASPPPPRACLPALWSLRKEGEAAPIPGRSVRVLPGGESPHFIPACSWQPGWSLGPSRLSSLEGPLPRAGELWARGFPTEQPEQFGKAVTSLWPGENGM